MKLRNNNFFNNFYPNSAKTEIRDSFYDSNKNIRLKSDMLSTVNAMEQNYQQTLNEDKNEVKNEKPISQNSNLNLNALQGLLSSGNDNDKLLNLLLSNFTNQPDKVNIIKEFLTYFSKNNNANSKRTSKTFSSDNEKIETSHFTRTSDYNLD